MPVPRVTREKEVARGVLINHYRIKAETIFPFQREQLMIWLHKRAIHRDR